MIYIGSHKKQYIGENTIADITLPNGICIRVVQKLTVDDIKKLNQKVAYGTHRQAGSTGRTKTI